MSIQPSSPMNCFPLAAATAPHKDGCSEPLRAGVAIRAKVSDEVDGWIREQIKAGSFPERLNG